MVSGRCPTYVTHFPLSFPWENSEWYIVPRNPFFFGISRITGIHKARLPRITSVFCRDRSQKLIMVATIHAMHIQAIVIMIYTNGCLDRKGAIDGMSSSSRYKLVHATGKRQISYLSK